MKHTGGREEGKTRRGKRGGRETRKAKSRSTANTPFTDCSSPSPPLLSLPPLPSTIHTCRRRVGACALATPTVCRHGRRRVCRQLVGQLRGRSTAAAAPRPRSGGTSNSATWCAGGIAPRSRTCRCRRRSLLLLLWLLLLVRHRRWLDSCAGRGRGGCCGEVGWERADG